MPNYCLSVLYKYIIQVENKNVGLKVGGGGAQTYHYPPIKKVGAHVPLAPPPPLPTPVYMCVCVCVCAFVRLIIYRLEIFI